jgi:hypothetical protein
MPRLAVTDAKAHFICLQVKVERSKTLPDFFSEQARTSTRVCSFYNLYSREDRDKIHAKETNLYTRSIPGWSILEVWPNSGKENTLSIVPLDAPNLCICGSSEVGLFIGRIFSQLK